MFTNQVTHHNQLLNHVCDGRIYKKKFTTIDNHVWWSHENYMNDARVAFPLMATRKLELKTGRSNLESCSYTKEHWYSVTIIILAFWSVLRKNYQVILYILFPNSAIITWEPTSPTTSMQTAFCLFWETTLSEVVFVGYCINNHFVG